MPKPRIQHPTIIVKPTAEGGLKSSVELKKTLDKTLSPKELGVCIKGCFPAQGNGLIIQLETPEMAKTLQEKINCNEHLGSKCLARDPIKRNPQIIVYDIERAAPDTPREEEERDLVNQIRSDNNLPEGQIKTLFRRNGRGNRAHWIISLDQAIYRSLEGKRVLSCGFTSYRFRLFCEPTRCFKCHRYGHAKINCPEEREACSRCLGNHNYKECRRQYPVCRNCVAHNRNQRTNMHADHTAISPRCPVYLAKREEILKQHHADLQL